jgi:hypothetical protein
MKARSFGVHSQERLLPELLQEAFQFGLGLDQPNSIRLRLRTHLDVHPERWLRAQPRRNRIQSGRATISRPAAISSNALESVL